MSSIRRQAPPECPICLQARPLTFHHFICRSVHRNKWFRARYDRDELNRGIFVCRSCHSTIHRLIPDRKVMSREYNSPARLMAHPEFAHYVAWARRRSRVGPVPADDPFAVADDASG
jgi:hypothetical protein